MAPYRPLPENISTLTGLRGGAAAIVVVSHSALAGLLPASLGMGFGQVGVALFYALSGFLMAHVTAGKPFARSEIAAFLVSRASRVLPLFYAAVTFALVGFALFGWHLYTFDSYGDAARALLLVRGASVLWSIPVEVQFYILFLLFWWAASRRKLPHALLAIGIPAFVLAVLLRHHRAGLPIILFWFHFFLSGIAVRWLLDDGTRNRLRFHDWRWANALGWAVVVLFIIVPPGLRLALGMKNHVNFLDPWVLALMPLVLWACCAGARPFTLLSATPVQWLGKLSYSIYLTHLPVLYGLEACKGFNALSSPLKVVIFWTLTLAVSFCTYRVIEKPALHAIRARFAARREQAPAMAVS